MNGYSYTSCSEQDRDCEKIRKILPKFKASSTVDMGKKKTASQAKQKVESFLIFMHSAGDHLTPVSTDYTKSSKFRGWRGSVTGRAERNGFTKLSAAG